MTTPNDTSATIVPVSTASAGPVTFGHTRSASLLGFGTTAASAAGGSEVLRMFALRANRYLNFNVERLAIAIVCFVPLLRFTSFLAGVRDNLSSYTWFVADGLAMGAWLAVYVRKPAFRREHLVRISIFAFGSAALALGVGARHGILTRNRVLGAAFQESCGDLVFLGLLAAVLIGGTL